MAHFPCQFILLLLQTPNMVLFLILSFVLECRITGTTSQRPGVLVFLSHALSAQLSHRFVVYTSQIMCSVFQLLHMCTSNVFPLIPFLFLSAVSHAQFASYEKVREVEEFFSSRCKPYIARTLRQSIERVQINANWVESIRNEGHLAEAVKELAYRKY